MLRRGNGCWSLSTTWSPPTCLGTRRPSKSSGGVSGALSPPVPHHVFLPWLAFAFLDTSKSFQSLGHFALPVSKSNFLAFPELARHPQHLPAHLNLLGYGSLHPLSPSLETYGAVDCRDQMSVFFLFFLPGLGLGLPANDLKEDNPAAVRARVALSFRWSGVWRCEPGAAHPFPQQHQWPGSAAYLPPHPGC